MEFFQRRRRRRSPGEARAQSLLQHVSVVYRSRVRGVSLTPACRAARGATCSERGDGGGNFRLLRPPSAPLPSSSSDRKKSIYMAGA